jgi:hypothetical protein
MVAENQKISSLGGSIVAILLLLNAIILREAFVNHPTLYWALTLSIPLLALAIFKVMQIIGKRGSDFS